MQYMWDQFNLTSACDLASKCYGIGRFKGHKKTRCTHSTCRQHLVKLTLQTSIVLLFYIPLCHLYCGIVI